MELSLAEAAGPASPSESGKNEATEQRLLQMLDAPLLFVKRHSYTGIHIYDTYYKWPPGGGGIYVLENPSAPRSAWKIRPVIDATTPGTLGGGVYTHPELSWDAKRVLFCYKGEPSGSTSIYEIGIDGQGLRRLTDPTPACNIYKGTHGGQHDIAPAYLPDGRIVFLSTRPSGLVPCANEGVSILHVMNADGSGIHPISVNNVNEFDPSVLPDGRILFGRWEYVDKNALTIQSLWTVHPDGTEETALYANNMVVPEAILDARPVPNSHLIVGTFAKHNAPPRGSIAFIDPRIGKNDPRAIANLEHPKDPTRDTGDSCEPWAISEEVVLFSGRPSGRQRNIIEMLDRSGNRVTVLSDSNICLHSPMLVKSRPCPPALPQTTQAGERTGRFLVQDIYRGLDGVKRGEVKWLRLIEETSRVSATHSGANPYNQTFLVSAALAFSVKNYLGIVPVDTNGSAYFEAPSGRALYVQALDGEGRLVQSMRTFVQAAPGVTRTCIGCHERKFTGPANAPLPLAPQQRKPDRPRPESWGSGSIDFSSMVQPILDRHCAECHGGKKGMAAGIDLTGGWTEHFNISYENLVSRRETQLIAYWIAGIDCMNGTAHWSSQIFKPRSHGSGIAPLAKLLAEGHDGRIKRLSRRERDLLMAWIDSNGLYHGTWDYSEAGCAIPSWKTTRQGLIDTMRDAGCARCHGETNQITFFENDWFNLREPELSRILRAPLAKGAKGGGLGLCRDRKVDPKRQRIRLLRDGYAHAIQPVEKFPRQPLMPPDLIGSPVVSFASTKDAHYQKMLQIIRDGRVQTLAAPRVDLPGAERIAGASRQFAPPPLPRGVPPLKATRDKDGVVHLAWGQSASTIGLQAEVHRSRERGFTPCEHTLLGRTTMSEFADRQAPEGRLHYALVLTSGEQASPPAYAALWVAPPAAPSAPNDLLATPASCAVKLTWKTPEDRPLQYNVYRIGPGQTREKLTAKPIRATQFTDAGLESREPRSYMVTAVSSRGIEGKPTAPATAAALLIQEPVFTAEQGPMVRGRVHNGETLAGRLHGKSAGSADRFEFKDGTHVTFPHRTEFELGQPFSIECWVWLDQPGKSPVLASCGEWRQAGWFLQRLGERWRWYVGGIDCDGGQTTVGKWVHLVGSYDGRAARLFENGKLVSEVKGPIRSDPWPGDLHLGQYSASPGPDFQVTGRMAGIKIYHRPVTPEEVAEAAKAVPK